MSTRPSFLAATTALLLLAAAAPASAQNTGDAALPFHAGQWGLAANVGQSVGIGALRFTAPNRAIVLDAAGSLHRDKRTVPTPPLGGIGSYDYVGGYATLSLGLRNYRPLGSSAALFRTLGVNGSYSSDGGSTHNWSAGVFGDLGAQYMFDPRFSLGVAAGLSVGYSQYRVATGFNGYVARTSSVGISTTPARLIGSVYF
jgi:hypothetical protein